MQNVMTELLKSFTTNHVEPDGTAIAMNENCVVIFKPVPENERRGVSKWMPGVFRADPDFNGSDIKHNLEGPLLAIASYSKNQCRLLEIGHQVEGDSFTPFLDLEIRTPEDHVYISASEELGKKLFKKLKDFSATHQDFVNESIAISDKNPDSHQLVAFHKDRISVHIPHEEGYDVDWHGYIHFNFKNNTFNYDFYDKRDNERFSVAYVWDRIEIDRAEFFVDALIENPVLPRNKDGILY